MGVVRKIWSLAFVPTFEMHHGQQKVICRSAVGSAGLLARKAPVEPFCFTLPPGWRTVYIGEKWIPCGFERLNTYQAILDHADVDVSHSSEISLGRRTRPLCSLVPLERRASQCDKPRQDEESHLTVYHITAERAANFVNGSVGLHLKTFPGVMLLPGGISIPNGYQQRRQNRCCGISLPSSLSQAITHPPKPHLQPRIPPSTRNTALPLPGRLTTTAASRCSAVSASAA